MKTDDLGSDDVEQKAGGSKTPVKSDLPSPPSPGDKWWSDTAHNCHLRLALGEDGCPLVEEAVTRRDEGPPSSAPVSSSLAPTEPFEEPVSPLSLSTGRVAEVAF